VTIKDIFPKLEGKDEEITLEVVGVLTRIGTVVEYGSEVLKVKIYRDR